METINKRKLSNLDNLDNLEKSEKLSRPNEFADKFTDKFADEFTDEFTDEIEDIFDKISVFKVDMGNDPLWKDTCIITTNYEYKNFIRTPLLDRFKELNQKEINLLSNKEEYLQILSLSIEQEKNIFSYLYLGKLYLEYYKLCDFKIEYGELGVKYLEISRDNGIINCLYDISIYYLYSKNWIELEKNIKMISKYNKFFSKKKLLALYEPICKSLICRKDYNSITYRKSAEYLKENKGCNSYLFYYSLIYKDNDHDKFLNLIKEGISNKCYSCMSYYGETILNDFLQVAKTSLKASHIKMSRVRSD